MPQGDILPDGSQAGEARQWLRRHRAEQELAAAEAAVQQGVQGAAKRLKAAERQLDAVLEAALGDGFDDFEDDFDALQAEEEEAAAPAAAAGEGWAGTRLRCLHCLRCLRCQVQTTLLASPCSVHVYA